MKPPAVVFVALLFVQSLSHAAGNGRPEPQESRCITESYDEVVARQLDGKGMSLIKAAEFNGYPSPETVLTLAPKLGLSDDQRAKTQTLFDAMHAEAKAISDEQIAAERELFLAFMVKQVTSASMESRLQRLATLQSRVRATYLRAHIEQAKLMTPVQISRYRRLCGYGDTGAAMGLPPAAKPN